VVDRDADARGLCLRQHLRQADQVLGREGQRLLGEHVLAGLDGGLDPGQAPFGTGGQVDVPHLGVG
jgi:hypothetical protein